MHLNILSLFSLVYFVAGAEDGIEDIVFNRGNFDIPGYEEVTTKGLDDFGALEKCGEGSDAGKRLCVSYYTCDGKTNTIIRSGKYDGFGVIDIRFGVNQCPHPLDVCCKIPEGGLPPPDKPVTEEPPEPSDQGSIDHCGIRNPNGIDFKITGNRDNEAEYGEFPWMVAVLKAFYNRHKDDVLALCGGSLITPSVVLTGAHCIDGYKPQEIRIRAGEWDTQTDKERLPYQERDVAQIIIHEGYNPKVLFNDVALIILKSPFKKADNIGTICLPEQGQAVEAKNCFASGWGKDRFGREGQYQVILKKIELPTVPHTKCQNLLRTTRLGKYFELDKSFTCAGGIEGRDTCTGDGGSPLVCPDSSHPGRYLQAGIVAWGIGCGEENIPGVYADVTKFREWIDNKLKRLNFDTKPYHV